MQIMTLKVQRSIPLVLIFLKKMNIYKLLQAYKSWYPEESSPLGNLESKDDLFNTSRLNYQQPAEKTPGYVKTVKTLTESLWSSHPLTIVLVQQSSDKVFSLCRQRRPRSFFETRFCLQDRPKYTWFCPCPERAASTQQYICNHTNTPHVCLSTIRSMQNFRSNIVCTSNNII